MIFTSENGKYSNRFTEVTDKSATSLLTINDATADDYNANYVCNVENSVGMSRKTFSLNSTAGISEAAMMIGGVLIAVLIIVAFTLFAIIFVCRKKKRRVINKGKAKLSLDDIGAPENVQKTIGHPFANSVTQREVLVFCINCTELFPFAIRL